MLLGAFIKGGLMKYVFGPLFSRRLGWSLGIDPIPMKTCNWNCIYCQLGRTIPLTNVRRDDVSVQDIITEVKSVLAKPFHPQPDWITIAGSGEPLLFKSLGILIRDIKRLTNIPVALLTNGSLFYLPEVRQAALDADAVLPSVDAGSKDVYRKMNRPHPEITFEKFIMGLKQFRKEYSGKLWPEVMLAKGINDSAQAIEDIAGVLADIKPDQIFINSPVRPPVEMTVKSIDEATLKQAEALFGRVAKIAKPTVSSSLHHGRNNTQDIIAIVFRHPLSEHDLQELLNHQSADEQRQILSELKQAQSVRLVERNGVRYWCPASAQFPN
jgi:wyosine [tRNA(Phe)-imidazoG37] synthetase (radical SAM superfamily)